ncbi:MAG: LPS assembly lipoprotein LptE, partial [Candidatus Acidiferrales bacterium]
MRRRFDLRRAKFVMLLAALACVFACASGCGYRVAGRAARLPSTWHTIAVPAFVNRTPTYRIEQRVTNAVVHELLARTKYRVVPRAAGAD